MNEELEQKITLIDSAFDSGELTPLASALAGMKAPDIAEIITALQADRQTTLFNILEREIGSEVLALLDEGTARNLLERMGEADIVAFIQLMESDDATDVINLLPPEQVQRILGRISREDYEYLKELLKFDEESAGGLMAREVVAVQGDVTITEVIKLLRDEVENIEHIHNVYIIDRSDVLVGIIPVIQLLVVDPESLAEAVMERDFIAVSPDTDQEEVAGLFSKYDLFSAPVVDDSGRLVGRITVDDVIDVIEDEASEDITIMAGTGDEEFWERSALKVSRARLPWLLTGLFGGIASAALMSHFKASIESVLALAFFVPVITAMGGNVGIQSSAIVVRELAIGGLSVVRTSGKLLRELKVSLINGVVLGSVLLVIVSVWQRDYRLGMFLTLCMMIIILWATLMGAVVPLLLKKVNIDPALATGPFITTSNDILGILIYLGIATLLIDWIR